MLNMCSFSRAVNPPVFPSSGASPTCVNTGAAALRRGAPSPATAQDQDTPGPPVTTVSTYSTLILQQVPDLRPLWNSSSTHIYTHTQMSHLWIFFMPLGGKAWTCGVMPLAVFATVLTFNISQHPHIRKYLQTRCLQSNSAALPRECHFLTSYQRRLDICGRCGCLEKRGKFSPQNADFLFMCRQTRRRDPWQITTSSDIKKKHF